MKALIYDPSGNFYEGKGTTGWSLFDTEWSTTQPVAFGDISASDFDRMEDYWQSVADIIMRFVPELVVCESFRLFHHKAKEQGGSRLETPQLIGFLRMVCYLNGIKFVEQAPSDKAPVNDERLTRQEVFEQRGRLLYCNGQKTNLHMRDAIRHGVYYFRFGEGRKRA